MDFFAATNWLEQTSLSLWIRESSTIWAFPFILILHTVGMAFLVGTNVALDARIFGVGRSVPLTSMLPFYRVMWMGFWVNAGSGVLLLIAYPTKALTNPLFYVKLGLIAAALVQAQWFWKRIRQEPDFGGSQAPRDLKIRAAASLACWLTAITAGRLLAYTYTRLMAYEGFRG